MSDFEKVLLKDDRLICSPQISYAVMKGAMNHTLVKYQALTGVNTERPASLTFNIQVPSEQTVMDRRVIIKNTFEVVVKKKGIANCIAEPVWNCDSSFNFGNAGGIVLGADCLNAYPFHQIVNTATITINNTAVSVNIQDVLTTLLRVNDDRNLNKFNGTTPIQADSDGGYGSTTSPSGNKFNSPFSQDMASPDEAFAPRGAFPVRVITTDNGIPAGGGEATTTIQFETYEPLMISPFTFANPQSGNSQGIYGLQNLNFNFTLANPNRLIRSRPQIGNVGAVFGNSYTATTVENWKITKSEIQLIYLTPQPTDALEARNAVPYYELPRYLSGATDIIASATWTNPKNPVASSFTIDMNSFQLNQIPDKLFLFVRANSNNSYNNNTNCADHYAVIDSVNINFNNQSGLLSTMTQNQLYRMSRDNGSSQSWTEFSGLVNTRIDRAYNLPQTGYDYATIVNGSTIGLTAGGINNQAILAPTTGSLLILQFGKDIELPDYYAPGSLGSFNIQITLKCLSYNNVATNYQAVMIPMNTGVFITEKGQSAVYTGLLTKEDVLQASAMEPIAVSDYKRMVGGGFWDNIKSVGSKVWNFVKPVLGDVGKFAAQRGATALSESGNPYASLAGNVLKGVVGSGDVGGAMSAGAMSAGAMSAGRRRVAKHLMR